MSQRQLLLEDPEPDIEELLEQMSTVMHYRTDRGLKWYARAVGSNTGFSEADTAVEAMKMALKEKKR